MANIDVLMPQMGESIQEATLTRWHKKVGDTVKREEILFEISTDKVDTEIPSPQSGILKEQRFPEGSVIPVHTVVAVLEEGAVGAQEMPKTTAPAAAVTAPATKTTAPATDEKLVVSPLAKKIAAELHVDLKDVQKKDGKKPSARITKEDVNTYLNDQSVSHPVAGPSLHDPLRSERVPMTSMRKKIAEHMVLSKRTSPHVTSVIEIDVQRIVDIRTQTKDVFEQENGFKLTYMPFFMVAALEAIKAVPIVNASVDGDAVIMHKDVHLGVAVALETGLIVPVIKQAQNKNFAGLGASLNTLAKKARQKKLELSDIQGGTFSISNYGGFGTIIGQPIINQPQVAIMGIGAMTQKPVVVNNAIAIHTTCYVVLTFDHRIMDGSHSGKFLSTVKQCLENWGI